MRSHAAEHLSVEDDVAARNRLFADDGAEEARLADAVAAHEARNLAGLGLEGDVAERLGGAVVQVDVGRFKHS